MDCSAQIINTPEGTGVIVKMCGVDLVTFPILWIIFICVYLMMNQASSGGMRIMRHAIVWDKMAITWSLSFSVTHVFLLT
jgi:hypothetical protein